MSDVQTMGVICYVGNQIDDVAISGDLFRMQQMARNRWLLRIYRGKLLTAFSLHWDRTRQEIVATLTEDSIGCTFEGGG